MGAGIYNSIGSKGPESAVSNVSRFKAGRVGLQAVLGEFSIVKHIIM